MGGDISEQSFHTHVPATPLRPYVAAATGYRTPANPTGTHRGLPSRRLTLVVELTAPLRVAGMGPEVAAHAVVGGLHTRPALIDASRPQEGLQYGLTPLGAGALLGVSAAELSEHTFDLVDVLGPWADRLVARLHDTATWPERFRLVDAAMITGSATAACQSPTRSPRRGGSSSPARDGSGSTRSPRTWRTAAGT